MRLEVNTVLEVKDSFTVIDVELQRFCKFTSFYDSIYVYEPSTNFKREISIVESEHKQTPYEVITDEYLRSISGEGDTLKFKLKYTKTDSASGVVEIEHVDLEYEEAKQKDIDPRLSESDLGGMSFQNMEDIQQYNRELLEQAKQIEQGLNQAAAAATSTTVEYYHVTPDRDDGEDILLKEYTLHNIQKKECLNIVIPGGEVPEIDPTYAEWGIEFQRFKVHILKTEFEAVFGINERIYNESFLFLPEWNRLYRVYSNSLLRGSGGQSTYYEVHLRDYDMNNAIADMTGEDLVEALTEQTRDSIGLFGDETVEMAEDVMAPKQNQSAEITDDPYRDNIELDAIVVEDLENNGNRISTGYYDLREVEEPITYKEKVTKDIDCLGVSFWFRIPADFSFTKPTEFSLQYTRDQIGLIAVTREAHYMREGEILKIGLNYFEVTDILTDTSFRLRGDSDIVPSQPGASLIDSRSFLSISDGNNEFNLSFIDVNRLMIIYGGQIRVIPTNIIDIEDKWLGLVLNVYERSKINISVHGENSDITHQNRLKPVSDGRTSLVEGLSFDGGLISLMKSEILLTNLRVYKTNIPDEFKQVILTSEIAPNESKIIVADNAKPPTRTDRLGDSRLNQS